MGRLGDGELGMVWWCTGEQGEGRNAQQVVTSRSTVGRVGRALRQRGVALQQWSMHLGTLAKLLLEDAKGSGAADIMRHELVHASPDVLAGLHL